MDSFREIIIHVDERFNTHLNKNSFEKYKCDIRSDRLTTCQSEQHSIISREGVVDFTLVKFPYT